MGPFKLSQLGKQKISVFTIKQSRLLIRQERTVLFFLICSNDNLAGLVCQLTSFLFLFFYISHIQYLLVSVISTSHVYFESLFNSPFLCSFLEFIFFLSLFLSFCFNFLLFSSCSLFLFLFFPFPFVLYFFFLSFFLSLCYCVLSFLYSFFSILCQCFRTLLI